MAHHECHMRELILDLAVREADACDEFIRYVDDRPDLHRHVFAFLMVLGLRLCHLALVATDEQSRDVVRVGELPWVEGLILLAHLLEVIDHLIRLTGLLER